MIILSTTTIAGAILLFCGGVSTGQTPPVANEPDSSGYSIVQRGPNSRVWQGAFLRTNAVGVVTTNLQSYVELATGICYLSNGEYVDSVEQAGLLVIAWTRPTRVNGWTTLSTPSFQAYTLSRFGWKGLEQTAPLG